MVSNILSKKNLNTSPLNGRATYSSIFFDSRSPIEILVDIATTRKNNVTPYVLEYLSLCKQGYSHYEVLGRMDAHYRHNNSKTEVIGLDEDKRKICEVLNKIAYTREELDNVMLDENWYAN